eukprot:GEMP01056400.1.p2 GENE.GEMP01056400.1~~GEMP01056400.1.p2  ORF type:complete len:123 (+),score=32.90 GEMP01056400.1:39-407(+)
MKPQRFFTTSAITVPTLPPMTEPTHQECNWPSPRRFGCGPLVGRHGPSHVGMLLAMKKEKKRRALSPFTRSAIEFAFYPEPIAESMEEGSAQTNVGFGEDDTTDEKSKKKSFFAFTCCVTED